MSFEEKLRALDRRIADLGRVAVAFSGGVDSTALLHACRRILGRDRVLAVTADSESFPKHEKEESVSLARRIDVEHLLVRTQELSDPNYRKNEGNRCYFCKKELFGVMERVAAERGVDSLVYGAIADDLLEFRPGARAAAEFRIAAPLQEAGMSKEDVRRYSRSFELPTADKPAFACLSSRVPVGIEVDAGVLSRIESAESVLRDLGYRQFRVRHHGECAKIEVEPQDLLKILGSDHRRVLEGVRAAGYQRVCLDLRGYKTHSLRPAENVKAVEEVFWLALEREKAGEFSFVSRLNFDQWEEILRQLSLGKFPSEPLPLDLEAIIEEHSPTRRLSCSQE